MLLVVRCLDVVHFERVIEAAMANNGRLTKKSVLRGP
jgi:hypothetical protein